jgi:hypothetical protein
MSMSMLQAVDQDLWTVTSPLVMLGLDIGTRMTVVRLSDGSLWLHSPIKPTPELRAEIDALGPVSCIVAPNRFHHLFAGDWKDAYPKASLFVAPGLETKRNDLNMEAVLVHQPRHEWADVLDQTVVDGLSLMGEVVFFHKPTRTLIVTDLCFHLSESSPPARRFGLKMAGYKGFGPTWLEWLLARDRKAFRASLERILAWDFDRVMVPHDTVLDSGGREALRKGYAWAL